METLKTLYQNFISLKKYFWTHCLMAIGWIVFFASLVIGLISCFYYYLVGMFLSYLTTYYLTKFVITYLEIPILLIIFIVHNVFVKKIKIINYCVVIHI